MGRTAIARLWDHGDGLANVWWRVRHRPWFPYPLRAARLSLDVQPFGFWLKPSWFYRKDMTEFAREQGETIWWARWAWFEISYSRWL